MMFYVKQWCPTSVDTIATIVKTLEKYSNAGIVLKVQLFTRTRTRVKADWSRANST
jgi:hypothetical protein